VKANNGDSLRWFYGRLVLALLAATALSFVAGFVVAEIAGNFPCEGEGLACNIDSAVGGYGVILSAALGPIVFCVTVLVAQSRSALGRTLAVLLALILGFYLLAKSDYWYYVGFEPYRSFRTFLVMTVPPALTVIVQWLILQFAVRHPVRPHDKSGSEPIPLSTE
jgi:nitrate/nitrite transporter NarK